MKRISASCFPGGGFWQMVHWNIHRGPVHSADAAGMMKRDAAAVARRLHGRPAALIHWQERLVFFHA
jgi:hypothetical protein